MTLMTTEPHDLPHPSTVAALDFFTVAGSPHDCDVFTNALSRYGLRTRRTKISDDVYHLVVYDPVTPVRGTTKHKATKFTRPKGKQWGLLRGKVEGMEVGDRLVEQLPNNTNAEVLDGFKRELRRNFPERKYVLRQRVAHVHVYRHADHD